MQGRRWVLDVVFWTSECNSGLECERGVTICIFLNPGFAVLAKHGWF